MTDMVNNWTREDLPHWGTIRDADDMRGNGDRSTAFDIALDVVVEHLNAHYPKPTPGIAATTRHATCGSATGCAASTTPTRTSSRGTVMPISEQMTIYRCYSPSRKEIAEDWNGFAYGEATDTFAEMVDEKNHPSEDEPRDWELQVARVEWSRHVDQ